MCVGGGGEGGGFQGVGVVCFCVRPQRELCFSCWLYVEEWVGVVLSFLLFCFYLVIIAYYCI